MLMTAIVLASLAQCPGPVIDVSFDIASVVQETGSTDSFSVIMFVASNDGNDHEVNAICTYLEWDTALIDADLEVGVGAFFDPLDEPELDGCVSVTGPLGDPPTAFCGVNEFVDDGDILYFCLALVPCVITPDPVAIWQFDFTLTGANGVGVFDISEVLNCGNGQMTRVLQSPNCDITGSVTPTVVVVEDFYIRGDADGNGTLGLADSTAITNYLFQSGTLDCLEAANVNGDAFIDVSDSIYLLAFLFSSGPDPAAPFPDCFLDGSDTLGCADYSCP